MIRPSSALALRDAGNEMANDAPRPEAWAEVAVHASAMPTIAKTNRFMDSPRAVRALEFEGRGARRQDGHPVL